MKGFIKYILTFLVFDLSFMVIMYFSKELLISLVLSLLFMLVFSKVIIPNYKKARVYLNAVDEANQVINSLSVQLSVMPSLDEALMQIKDYCSNDVKDLIINNSYPSGIEKMEQISFYINQPIMYVFVSQLKAYIEQGGDILSLSRQLINQANHLKSSAHLFSSIKKRKLKEFSTVWVFSLISLLYLRTGLESYYLLVLKNSFLFKYAIGLMFLILIISYGLFFRKYGDYYMEKGWDI